MKKSIYILTALTLAVGVLFSSCSNEKNPDENESDTVDFIDEPTFDFQDNKNDSGNKGEDKSEVVSKNDDESASSEEITDEETTVKTDNGTLIGYTSKNYPITVKDGITYVDGVLVANKTYALPEYYEPGDLLSECQSAFDSLQAAASKEGLSIWISSGFRSYSLQESLYKRYSDRDGQDAADRYSARPGHSEHQTGLAIDLNTISQSFADTAEGKWIAENCWKYGFILRYPKEKEAQTGYMYEPWHIRYVGTQIAEDIYSSGLCLEEYYGITSQYSDYENSLKPSESVSNSSSELTTSAPLISGDEVISDSMNNFG